jgi:hypothetical protein
LLLQAHQVHHGAGFEGALAGEQLVQQQAQRVNIALDGDLGAGQLLRRHVGRRAAAHVALQLAVKPASPKSMITALAAAVDHDVGRLQIAVQHALFVRRGEAGADLRAVSTALSTGSRPMRRSSTDRSSPSTYSIEMNSMPSTWPTS